MPKGEYRFFGIKLNPDKDADMICFLESKKNKQDYIKKLIHKDMLHDTLHCLYEDELEVIAK